MGLSSSNKMIFFLLLLNFYFFSVMDFERLFLPLSMDSEKSLKAPLKPGEQEINVFVYCIWMIIKNKNYDNITL